MLPATRRLRPTVVGLQSPMSRMLRPGFSRLAGPAALTGAALVFVIVALAGVKAAELSIVALLALALVVGAASCPGAALSVVVVFVPLQLPLLALLFKYGGPAALVRDFSFVKDMMAAGVVVAAVRAARQSTVGARIDWLDRFAVVYLGIATAYLLLPFAFRDILGGNTFMVRLNAWRLDCLFVVLLLAGRRIRFRPRSLSWLRSLVLTVALAMLVFAIWEAVAPDSYDHLLIRTIGLPAYQSQILNVPPPVSGSYVSHGTLGGATFTRVGSLFTDPLSLAFYSVIPVALGFERLVSGRLRVAMLLVTLGAIATCVLTITRSGILSMAIALALGVVLAYRRLSPARLRTAVMLTAGVVLALILSGHSVTQQRFLSIFQTQNVDNQGHITASQSSLHQVLAQPQGKGLGANPDTGQRNNTSNYTTSEDSYLQVGIELGLAAMLAFVAMYLALLHHLRRAAASHDPPGSLAAAMWMAGGGLFVGGFFLHIWISLPVSLTYWGLAGACLAPPGATLQPQSDDWDDSASVIGSKGSAETETEALVT